MANRTIWIAVNVLDKFDAEENKSGLINRLLTNHYAVTKPGVFMPSVEKEQAEKMARFKELKKSLGASPNTETVEQPDWGA